MHNGLLLGKVTDRLANLFIFDHRTFSVGDLVLVSLGDAVPHLAHQKSKMHAGSFKISVKLSGNNFAVKGADGVEVAVHVNKLLPYSPCKADLVGNGTLAASAMGAAEARVLAHEKLWESAVAAPPWSNSSTSAEKVWRV